MEDKQKSEMFMERLKRCFNNNLTAKHILFTADVKSLYTSIPLNRCLEVTVNFVENNLDEINIYDLSGKDFEMILYRSTPRNRILSFQRSIL